jgi:quinol monooxygenase YgiN
MLRRKTAKPLALGPENGNRATMKRPIAELLTIQVKPDAGSERRQAEQETWQILRRKQGYVTHRIYQHASDPLQWLLYSEWESKKAVDGARQHLQATPLGRRARAALAAAPQRLVLDLVGPVTSTKGLDLPESAVAATMMKRLAGEAGAWHADEARLWTVLLKQAGHIAHVLFRGFDDPLLVGSLSHWLDASTLDAALAHMNSLEGLPHDLTCVQYKPLRE